MIARLDGRQTSFETSCKGLAKLGNIVAEANVSQFLAEREPHVVETNFAVRKQ